MRQGRRWWLREAALVLSVVGTVLAGAACWPVDTGSATTPVPREVRAPDASVFGIGDSLLQQCGEDMGLGRRSVGFAAWPGATSADLIGRLDGTGSGWPADSVTEASPAQERAWFRRAGTLVVSLGTNDVKELTVAEWRANIDWFLEHAHGRPVLWFTVHNPVFPAATRSFNDELRAAAETAPNLVLVDWAEWAEEHPTALLPDQVHLATHAYGCTLGRDRLLDQALPADPASGRAPDRG